MNKKTIISVAAALILGVILVPMLGNEKPALGFSNGWGSAHGMINGGFDNNSPADMMGGSFNGGMMDSGMMGGSFNRGMMDSNMMGGTLGGNDMWGGNSHTANGNEVMTEEEILGQVDRYISQYDADLVPGDLFKYSDTAYYVSVENGETGMGAFELLVDPYTGAVRPEQGPNMMWNEEYSSMAGMHGFYNEENTDILSQKKAIAYANQYLNQRDPSLVVSDEGHQFPGYYTLHVEKDGEDYGMLSVHSATGEVWYHNWHGNLVEVKNLHNEEH